MNPLTGNGLLRACSNGTVLLPNILIGSCLTTLSSKILLFKGKFQHKHEILFRLIWTNAVDTAGATHLAFVQFDRMGGSDKVAVDTVIFRKSLYIRDGHSFQVGLKPAKTTKGTYWQGFIVDFSDMELMPSTDIEEVVKPLSAK